LFPPTHPPTHTHTHTCNLASVELEAQGDAVPPSLRSDANKPGQDWLRDAVQNHLGWVCVGVENLGRRRGDEQRLLSERRCTAHVGVSLISLFLTHTHPPTVRGFTRLHTHTVAGRTKQRQPKHGSNVTSPAVDVFWGQRVGAGRLGKPVDGWRVSLSHTHTHTHTLCSLAHQHPYTSVTVGGCGRHDLTRLNSIGRQTQEVSPGGQDVSDITFPKHQHSPRTLPSFHLL